MHFLRWFLFVCIAFFLGLFCVCLFVCFCWCVFCFVCVFGLVGVVVVVVFCCLFFVFCFFCHCLFLPSLLLYAFKHHVQWYFHRRSGCSGPPSNDLKHEDSMSILSGSLVLDTRIFLLLHQENDGTARMLSQ